jgi:hypothetical protein
MLNSIERHYTEAISCTQLIRQAYCSLIALHTYPIKVVIRFKRINFKVCKSVHHHTIKKINQPDPTISPVYYLTFIYSLTCFGRLHAHHQELNNCSSSLWFYRWRVVVTVLLVVVGPAGPTTTNSTATTTLQR